MDERHGEVIRQAYGIALVEYFPAINNSQGISRPQGPPTETSFYRWGYVDQLRGPYDYPESSERESLRAYRLEPTFYILPTVIPPSTVMATRNAIRAFWNVLVFCEEVSNDDCGVEYAVRRHDLLLEELHRNAAEILEIGSYYRQPKSWENHVICEYVNTYLMIVLAMVGMLVQQGQVNEEE
jgi:hypothetical protein